MHFPIETKFKSLLKAEADMEKQHTASPECWYDLLWYVSVLWGVIYTAVGIKVQSKQRLSSATQRKDEWKDRK